MAMYFSASMNGFYPDIWKESYEKAGTWPADAVEISENWHDYLVRKQGNGKNVSANEYGQPVLADQPPPTREELISQAEEIRATLMASASAVILPLEDASELDIATEEEAETLLRWKRYRVMLSRLDISAAPSIEWPELPA
ncbi:TPA: tail fiber assembly protein [Enterobacter soli]|uniref:Tail fiber assembly protein n=1 Tax=Enterobacter soli TaxID=885040 RepID=A0AAW8H3Q2_9ENTR|nr:tail fiber assembly protein [Enterobacter soli]MDQ2255463.1 tail fiber assembly protein [Enterobacter soli]MDQ2338115.1 tail fiber assembly protein [Enterobacter soli]HEE9788909.1 tail fiber assembly protein [Enterobacter soli]